MSTQDCVRTPDPKARIPDPKTLDPGPLLVPDMGQCPTNNRFMSDESCFTKDKIVRREVKNKIISYRRLKTQKHSVSIVSVFCFLCL